MCGVSFVVGTPERSVEDIIGRVMHEARINLAASDRQIPHRQRVSHVRSLRLALRNIDLIVSGGIEDHGWIEFGERLLYLRPITDVNLPSFIAANFVPAFAQLGAKFLSELSTAAEYNCS